MHWILLTIAAAALGGAFFAPTPGMIGTGLVVGLICLFAGFFAMISARIAERSRPDATLLTDADVNALRKSMRESRAAKAAAAAPPRSPAP
jgi:hypothetical protein